MKRPNPSEQYRKELASQQRGELSRGHKPMTEAEKIATTIRAGVDNTGDYEWTITDAAMAIRAYGEACRREGAEAMCDAALEAAACTGAPIDTDAAIRRALAAQQSRPTEKEDRP